MHPLLLQRGSDCPPQAIPAFPFSLPITPPFLLTLNAHPRRPIFSPFTFFIPLPYSFYPQLLPGWKLIFLFRGIHSPTPSTKVVGTPIKISLRIPRPSLLAFFFNSKPDSPPSPRHRKVLSAPSRLKHVIQRSLLRRS